MAPGAVFDLRVPPVEPLLPCRAPALSSPSCTVHLQWQPAYVAFENYTYGDMTFSVPNNTLSCLEDKVRAVCTMLAWAPLRA